MSIIVNNLTKTYDNQKAVDDISFEVNPGEVLGFLGPNGAGKTTTMRVVTCFIPPTEGSVSVCNYDITQDPMKVRENIGYLPEDNPLYLEMYVREYLTFMAGLHHLGKNSKKRIDEMISIAGLEAERKKKIGALSKGYRQRVGLAQAMLHNPPVLILDEPTSGLDPNQLTEIRTLIKELGREKTVIFSTHILQEVVAISNRVVIIHQGKIVADNTLAQLQQQAGGESSVTVTFKQNADKAQLTTIKGVNKVDELGNNKWILYAAENVDLSEAIYDFAVQQNLTLLEMQKEQKSLEDIFRSLTQ